MLMKESYFYKKDVLISAIQTPKPYPYVQIYAALSLLIDDNNEFIVDKYKKEINESDPIRSKLRNLLIKPATFLSALSLKTEDYKLCSTYTLINLKGKEEN